MSVNELKLFKAILSKVKYNDSLFDDYYVVDYSLLNVAGITKRDRYKEIEKSLTKLMNTFVTIKEKDRKRLKDPLLEKGAKGNRKLGLIKNDWTHEPRSMQIVVSIPDILKPFFLELAEKEYTIYALENLRDLHTSQEILLYELFAKWKNRGFFHVTLENLKEYLLVKDKYKRYSDFKRRMLVASIDTINKFTDLHVEYRELKENGDIITRTGPGNKVYSIEFIITDKDSFNKEEFKGKYFNNGDMKFLILDLEVDKDGLIELKLYDAKVGQITRLLKKITREEFLSCVE